MGLEPVHCPVLSWSLPPEKLCSQPRARYWGQVDLVRVSCGEAVARAGAVHGYQLCLCHPVCEDAVWFFHLPLSHRESDDCPGEFYLKRVILASQRP